LPTPRCPPVRLKLLGEELVAFRDGTGAVGIVQSRCAHRLAPLFFGRVEERGLRCAYHGWVFDPAGQCISIPAISNPDLWARMRITAYPAREKAGVIWIYMGEGGPPSLPRFPWIDLAPEQRSVSVWLQETNWVQGVEGEIDTSHIAMLHKTVRRATRAHRHYTFSDPAPQLTTHDTPIGFLSVARRNAEGQYYWRVTQWMAPMFSFIPSYDWPVGGRAWIPIDDENTYTWDFSYTTEPRFSAAFRDVFETGSAFPPERSLQPIRLSNGSVIDTWLPRRNATNDYLVDRSLQGDAHMTGIHGLNDQDRAIQEGMGRIVDRSLERLVVTDRAVLAARRKLLDIMQSEESIARFADLVRDGSVFARGPLDRVSPTADAGTFLADAGLV